MFTERINEYGIINATNAFTDRLTQKISNWKTLARDFPVISGLQWCTLFDRV